MSILRLLDVLASCLSSRVFILVFNLLLKYWLLELHHILAKSIFFPSLGLASVSCILANIINYNSYVFIQPPNITRPFLSSIFLIVRIMLSHCHCSEHSPRSGAPALSSTTALFVTICFASLFMVMVTFYQGIIKATLHCVFLLHHSLCLIPQLVPPIRKNRAYLQKQWEADGC